MGFLDIIQGLVNNQGISNAFLQDNIPASSRQIDSSKPQATPVQPQAPSPVAEPASNPVSTVSSQPIAEPVPTEPPVIISDIPSESSMPDDLPEEDCYCFSFPPTDDILYNIWELRHRASEGESGCAIALALHYTNGRIVEPNNEEAVFWLTRAFQNPHAPSMNIRAAAKRLGQWYILGFYLPVDYKQGLYYFEQCAMHESITVLPYIEELKEVIAIQSNPDNYLYLDQDTLLDLSDQAYENGKLILSLFYIRELMKQDEALGYYYYGDTLLYNNPVDFNDYAHSFARACLFKARELGCLSTEIPIAQSYAPQENCRGDVGQMRRWLEEAIKQNVETAQECFEQSERFCLHNGYLQQWNSDEPLRIPVYPDWYLSGICPKETAKTKETSTVTEPRTLPENIDSYFEGFIGMTHVKEQLQKIYNAVKLQQRRDEILRQKGEEPALNDKGFNFILLGNPGTGKTSVARIIAKILYDLNIRENDILLEVERSKLVGEHIGSTEGRMRDVLEKVQGGTLFIDEAYTLYKEDDHIDFGQEAIDVLMKDMEDNRNSYTVIMAGYKQPMLNMIKNANSGFSSRFTYQIEIPDYTEDELIEIAHIHIEKLKYQIDDDVDDAIRKCIRHDKIDDTFGNARYARELVNRAVENQSTRLNSLEHASDDDLFLLTAVDFWEGTMEEDTVETYLKELDSMVGLASVKEEVKTLVNRITVMAEMEKRGLALSGDFGTLHMAFKGNPGTGKTTVARLLGKLYAALGILKRNDVFVECNRAGLVGKYQGHTAAIVEKVVQSALGGILFIDEAYSLVKGDGDTFGKEAVDTLVAEIENHRKNLVVIFAGYSEDLDRFFENNQGLKSRVPLELIFEDYTTEELFTIAINMIQSKKMKLAEDAALPLAQLIQTKSTGQDFGNARGIRNLVDGFIRQQNVRIANALGTDASAVTDEALITLTKEDIY